MAQRKLENRVYRLLIELDGTHPSVWRRVEVPATMPLVHLHMLIQSVMGWENSHMHGFEFGRRRYSAYEDMIHEGDLDEYEFRVGDVLSRKGSKGTYTYDFGDDWLHLITVEATGEADPDIFYPRLLDGAGAGPPEDCGGVGGFEHLRTMRDHPERIDGVYFGLDPEEERAWVEEIEPDDLDLDGLQDALRAMFEALEKGELPPADPDLYPEETPPPMRPVSLAPEAELARTAAETEPLRGLLALARWFGSDRELTSSGVPKPADVRAAVTELGLLRPAAANEAAVWDEKLRRLRSARDLPGFPELWEVALDLRLIETLGKRVRGADGVLEGLPDERVLGMWAQLFEDALNGEPMGKEAHTLDPQATDLAVRALMDLYDAPDDAEIPLHSLVEGPVNEMEEAGFSDGIPVEQLMEVLVGNLYAALFVLVSFGGVRLVDHTPDEVSVQYQHGRFPFLIADPAEPSPHARIDCAAVLTPLGRYGVREMLLKSGIPAPLVGESADAGAAEFLDALSLTPPEFHQEEIAAWTAGRAVGDAVRDITEAASEVTAEGALRRAYAAEVLNSLGAPAQPELRDLLGSEHPALAALAAGALMASGTLTEAEYQRLSTEYGPWLAIDMASGPLEQGEEYLAFLIELNTEEGTGPIGELLLADANRLWTIDHPGTVPVLEALGRLHPDKKVAKEARRAAHKARSRS
ncbi:plasmid pRiA4b ORF-3 family protein [Nocardiopsis oceani]